MHPILHRFQVIVKLGSKKLETSVVRCELHFDILNRLGVAHECDGQTDKMAFSNTTV